MALTLKTSEFFCGRYVSFMTLLNLMLKTSESYIYDRPVSPICYVC